jgi:metal-responsive CopG/Arc/MetJ family transcriptional regulator
MTAHRSNGMGAMPDGDQVLVSMTIRLPRRLLARIDNHWHGQRLISRSETVRALLEQALERSRAYEKTARRVTRSD